MISGFKLTALFILILSMSLLASGTEDTLKVSDVSTPITGNLSISKIPVLNENTELVFRIDSIDDAPNTTAKIILPEGVQLIAGNISGSLDLKANVPAYLNATVIFLNKGDYKIMASALHAVDENESWGDLKALYLTIGEKESMFSTGPSVWGAAAQSQPGNATIAEEAKEIPINETLSGNMAHAFDISSIPSIELNKTNEFSNSTIYGSETAGTLTVTGHWDYLTQLSDYRPSPDVYDYAREFYVRVIKTSDSSLLGQGYTDLSGFFSIPITNPGTNGFQVQLFAYSKRDGLGSTEPELRVVDNELGGITGLNYVWRWITPSFTASDGVTDIGTWHPIENYEACWLLNDLIQAWRYAWYNTPGDAGPGTIVWFSTAVYTEGSHYHRGGQIHLEGIDAESGDTSIHEYGHNVMWNQYQGMPTTYCPSPHYFTRWSHVNCGWTEGWADFWPLAVFGNPTYTWSGGSFRNVETATWGTSGWDNGDGVEGRVAGALLDILDDANDGNDRYAIGINPIWNAAFSGGTIRNNFAEWWSNWLNTYGYTNVAQYDLYQNTIDYRLPWVAIPGSTTSTPALAADSSEFYMAIRGTDNGIYFRKTTGGSWTGSWEAIPGSTKDVPAIAVLDNKVHLVIRGTDNGIYHKIKDLGTGTWSGWTVIPGATTSSPALSTTNYGSTTTNTLHLVIRGTDNGIYYKSWTSGGGWTSWVTFPGSTNDMPSIASQGSQTLHVAIRGTDNGIYHKTKSLPSGSWTGWSLIGSTGSSPTLSWMPGSPGLIVIAVRGTDNIAYYNVWGSSWTGWGTIPGTTSSKPAGNGFYVGSYSYAGIAIRGTDSGIYNWYGGWPGWLNIPGGTSSYPAIAARGSGSYTQTGIAIKGIDNGIYFARR